MKANFAMQQNESEALCSQLVGLQEQVQLLNTKISDYSHENWRQNGQCLVRISISHQQRRKISVVEACANANFVFFLAISVEFKPTKMY